MSNENIGLNHSDWGNQIERISTADGINILNTGLEHPIHPVTGVGALSLSTAVLAA